MGLHAMLCTGGVCNIKLHHPDETMLNRLHESINKEAAHSSYREWFASPRFVKYMKGNHPREVERDDGTTVLEPVGFDVYTCARPLYESSEELLPLEFKVELLIDELLDESFEALEDPKYADVKQHFWNHASAEFKKGGNIDMNRRLTQWQKKQVQLLAV